LFSAIDEDSTILYGTNSGLLRFNKNQKSFEKLNLPGRIQNEEFNRESSFKHPDGFYYFGSVNGIYIVDPTKTSHSIDNMHTNVQLMSVKFLDGKTEEFKSVKSSFSTDQKLTFQHNDKMVNFRVTRPNFAKETKTFYSFLLKEFDSEWSPAQLSNEIRFTNLDPGSYTLFAKSGISPETLVGNQKLISFKINQAWYKTTLFRMLLVFLSGCILSFIIWIRYKQLLKYQLLRSNISQDLHDDVGTMLTGIAMQSELIEAVAKGDVKDLAGGISVRSREAMNKMRDTVWAIDSSKDSSLDLKDRLLDYIQDVLPLGGISYAFNSNIKSSD